MHITCAIRELSSTQPVNIPIEQENFPINELGQHILNIVNCINECVAKRQLKSTAQCLRTRAHTFQTNYLYISYMGPGDLSIACEK